MSEKELREMFARASAWAESHFAKVGEIKPMFHVITAAGEEFVMNRPPGTKDESMAFVRLLFEQRNAVRYLLVDEAWMMVAPTSKGIPDDEMRRIYKRGIADHPQRVEIVMFSGEAADCGQLMAYREIIRPSKGKAWLGPFKWSGEALRKHPGAADHAEDRFVGLLPIKGPKQ